MNAITYRTALEIASHEAIIRQAYKDSVGVWTWSVGLTSATGHDVQRYKDNPQTMEHCLAIYAWALDKYADAVRKTFAGTPLSEAQFAAALSFHWNTGAITKATWVNLFRAGDMAAAEAAFLTWNKPAEIKKRRQAEADLLFRGKWSSDGSITEYTKVSASYTPIWSSGKRVNIEAALKAALGISTAPAPVTPVQPKPDLHTLIAQMRDLINQFEKAI
ncbi:lysozyme [Aureimonas altamirensis]|uniref:lysozyme n=1 Tax=Aureimonas altamirensis TaxID=370622 RepID=UPI002554DF54|nr:glycoside hydrolase family protein [Aureimonas altamirensis]